MDVKNDIYFIAFNSITRFATSNKRKEK